MGRGHSLGMLSSKRLGTHEEPTLELISQSCQKLSSKKATGIIRRSSNHKSEEK